MGNEGISRSHEPDEESLEHAEEQLRKITEQEDEADRLFDRMVDTLALDAFKANYERLKQIDSEAAEQYKEHIKWTRDWVKRMGEEINHFFATPPND